MQLAKVVGLGNAGGCKEPQWERRQMAVLPLPSGRTSLAGIWVIQP